MAMRSGGMGLVLAIALAACGAQNDWSPPGELRLNLRTEPPTLDWTRATDNVSITVIEQLMRGLTELGPDLRPRGLRGPGRLPLALPIFGPGPPAGSPTAALICRREPARPGSSYAERRLRPLARRRAKTFRPAAVFIRARKPCRRLRTITLGWKVLFGKSSSPR